MKIKEIETIIVVAFLAGAQTLLCAQGAAAPKRDLSKYDNGGHYQMSYNHRADTPRDQAKAREFLWNHWKAHRRGWVILDYFGPDSESKQTFYVEPDSRGMWCVRISIFDLAIIPPNPVKPTMKDYEPAYRVERVSHTVNPSGAQTPVPENSKLSGDSYELQFLSSNGEVIFEF